MKTKPPEPISTAFPTCGEVFHYVITALNLPAWADAFHDSTDKRREVADIKAQSDQLRDWATEAEGRAPSRRELEQFICHQVRGLPQEADLAFVLCNLWANLLDEHADVIRENATYLDRKGTRGWYAVTQAPRALYFLWVSQKLLGRLDQTKGPMLYTPLDALLATARLDSAGAEVIPKHPLHLACYQHYAETLVGDDFLVDSKTIAAWKSGEDRPSCDALGRHFADLPDKLGLLLNFAFASLIEGTANALRDWIPEKDWAVCSKLLIGQARCVHTLDEVVAKAEARTPNLSSSDYGRLLGQCLRSYMDILEHLEKAGVGALDLRVAKFQVYQEYQRTVANLKIPPGFGEFHLRLRDLWKNTVLHTAALKAPLVEAEVAKLRATHPDWCKALTGPLLAIEARQVLCQEPPTAESLQRAFSLYQDAFSAARYSAGTYTTSILREALGLGAMLHRRETGEGAIKPWMKKMLAWWDLLGLGKNFDHEQLEQRIELAETQFADRLHDDLRTRLRSALPQLGLRHWNVGGLLGFVESDLIEQLEAKPVDRRQKKPMSETIVGRDQTALMEAIDRGQPDLARELVRKGADLNFINSTGDTCVTKAFARKDYDLVLEILRRDHEPIRRETLLRVTEKMRISGLEQSISTGQVEILRELAKWKPGRGDLIDLSKERIWGQTPLYYAISCLVHYRMNTEDALKVMPKAVAGLLRKEQFEAVRQQFAKEQNPDGLLECIRFLTNEQHVDLDVPNTNDNTALTYAAERRLHDVAAMLLAAGANVNHRFQGGGTALVRAIINDDYEMAKLLIEYKADYRLFVDALEQPIYAMRMSEQMRRLIPDRI